MVTIDTSFCSNFTVSRIDERPSIDASLKYFFRPKSRARDGLLFKVKPIDQPAWHGMCAFGDFEFCGIFTHPHKEKLFVVSRGLCYLINAMSPEEYSIGPTVASVVSHCHGCHPGQPSADVLAGELSHISGSWGTVPFFFLAPEEKFAEAAIEGAFSLRACRLWCGWGNITTGKSITNVATNVSSNEFVNTLLQGGFRPMQTASGKVVPLTNGEVRYVVHPWADSTEGPTADYYGASPGIQLKIRLIP